MATITETSVGQAAVAVQAGAVSIKIIRGRAGFEALAPVWDATLQRSAANTVFLTHEWLSTWVRHFAADRPLVVLVATCGDETVGLAPLMIRRRDRFNRLGTLGVETLDCEDIILGGDTEPDRAGVLSALVDAVMALPGWDYWQFNRIPDDSDTIELLQKEWERRGLRWSQAPSEQSPYVPISGSWDEYYGSLSSRLRKNIRRCDRQLAQAAGDVVIEEATNRVNAPAALESLFDLHAARRERLDGTPGLFDSDAVRRFYLDLCGALAGRGWVEVPALYAGGELAAIQLNFRYGGSYMKALPAFDESFAGYAVGRMLNVHVMRRAFETGFNRIDFLRGVEKYKFDFKPEVRQLYSLSVYAPTLRGALARQWFERVRPVVKSNRLARALSGRARS